MPRDDSPVAGTLVKWAQTATLASCAAGSAGDGPSSRNVEDSSEANAVEFSCDPTGNCPSNCPANYLV